MRNPWISHLTMYLFLAQGLSAQSGREILGMVFHRGENGDPVQEHGVIVTWTETGNSDETNDQGIFRLPLLAKSQPGDPITLATDKVGWRIRYPLDGETLVPRHPEKAMQVELLPLGSKLFWSDDDRIEKFIREVAERSKREGMREGQNQPLELGLYLREWAAKYGFSPQEAREQVDRWIAEVDARHDDNYRQGLADFAKLHFDQAAVRFHDSAERSIRQLEELGIQQSQLANQTAAVREQVVRDLRLEGNSHYQAYRYEEALTAYERAHQFTSREETLKLWAATLEEIGEAHRSLGSYGPTAESTEHLSRALSSFRQILLAVSRDRLPQQWAAAQSNVANCLYEQGTRAAGEAGQELIAQAVAAYRQALLVLTLDRFPQPWATLQTNLGTALQEQGKLIAGQRGDQLLLEAAEVFRQVLLVLSRDFLPEEWARAQNNFGITLHDQSTRTAGEPGSRLLAQAIDAYRQALLVFTKEKWSQDWVTTQINLGNALKDQSARTAGESGEQLLAQTVDVYRQALLVSTLPQQTAMLHYNLGLALKEQGLRMAGEARNQLLTQAVGCYRRALLFYTRDSLPVLWAEAQNSLGLALQEQGIQTAGKLGDQLLAQADDAHRQALLVFTRDQLPQEWARAQNNLAIVLAHQGDRTPGEAGNQLLAQAVDLYREALLVRTREQLPQQWAMTQNNLAGALLELGNRTGDGPGNQLRAQALEAFHQAVLIFTPADQPYLWRITRYNEASALLAIDRSDEAVQALTEILAQAPDDRQALLSLVNTLGDRLQDPAKAAALSQDWLQRHSEDQEVRILHSEQLFAAKDFAACRQELAAILNAKDAVVEPATRAVLLAYAIAADFENDGSLSPDRIGEIIALAARQGPDFKLSRPSPGILHSLESGPEHAQRDLVIRLFRTLEAPDRDTLIRALRELREATPRRLEMR